MKTQRASITWERASFSLRLAPKFYSNVSATKDTRYRPSWYDKALLKGKDHPKDIYKNEAAKVPQLNAGRRNSSACTNAVQFIRRGVSTKVACCDCNFAVVLGNFFQIVEATMAFYRLELCSLFFIILSEISFAYFVTIDAHAEECFHDQVTSGTKMGLIFEVAEGGFLDIDVTVMKHQWKANNLVFNFRLDKIHLKG